MKQTDQIHTFQMYRYFLKLLSRLTPATRNEGTSLSKYCACCGSPIQIWHELYIEIEVYGYGVNLVGWNEGRTCAEYTGPIQRVDAKLRWVRHGGLRLR